ncbi:MAG: hypothetical protein DRN21_01600 [Thermoplasmata archaeon]|nr:MAG: hypothetical protein DRN21_01600 [Thermoplasmata archaeon]
MSGKKTVIYGVVILFVLAAVMPALGDNNVLSSHNKESMKLENDMFWSIETVDHEGFVGRYTSIALDSQEYPHISYCDAGNWDLKYAYWDGSEWKTETVDTKYMAGVPTAIVLDSKGYPHIAYHEAGHEDLKYAYWTGSEWHMETVESEGRLLGHLDVTLDENDYPHILYCDKGNGNLKYAYWTGSEWHMETVDACGDIGWFSVGSIILKEGNPYIAYAADNELKYGYWTGSEWHIEVVATENGEIHYTSMALDSKGYPHICYQDYENGDLEYVYWDGAEWHKETVLEHSSTEGYGGSSSLSLDSHDYPHIEYYRYIKGEDTDRDQEYIYWDGSKWNREVIESEGYVGGCSDIVLDSNDNPVMSYFNWDLGDLKCARKTANAPPEKPDRPSGWSKGATGRNYTYKTSATDAEGDQLWYMFDWGDGTSSEWLGPHDSGETVKATHAWDENGTYEIRVKVKDSHYSESVWSDPLPVTMPKTYSILEKLFEWILRMVWPGMP